MRKQAATTMALAGVLMMASASLAQLGGLAPPPGSASGRPPGFESGKAPTPQKADPDGQVLVGYLAVLIILGAVAGANLIPSKRGHQD